MAGWVWSVMTGHDLEKDGLVRPDPTEDDGVFRATDELDPGLPMPALQDIAAVATKPKSDAALLCAIRPLCEVSSHILWNSPQALRWIALQRASVDSLKSVALSTKASFWKQQAAMIQHWPPVAPSIN
ncbi:hypothetical protein SDC9_110834 [bioreactor metagenome]|uniref:Uncharacterized protein n=1 Tax=bioreactor metagenome TaxID=1076179 RepID=A0A645BES3_9ZZZZ